MPCNSDYMEPTAEEENTKLVCKLLLHVHSALKLTPSVWMVDNARLHYPTTAYLTEATVKLCALCKGMTPAQKNRIIYDARNPMSRRLADWWEEHQKADRHRLVEERKEQERERIRQQALKKLSAKERKVLFPHENSGTQKT